MNQTSDTRPTDSNGANEQRDARGRFRNGNEGGPGNPRLRQLAAHQAAVRDALTPDELKAVLKKLYGMAIDGDVSAARVVLDRSVGRARAEPETPPSWRFDPEDIQTQKGRNRAIKSIVGAVVTGELLAGDGEALVGFIKAVDEALPPEILETLGI